MSLGLGLGVDKHLNSDHNLNFANQFLKNQNTYSRSTNQQLFNDMQSTAGGNITQFTNNTQVILIFINSCSYFRDTILHINHSNLLIFKGIILIQSLKILHKYISINQIT